MGTIFRTIAILMLIVVSLPVIVLGGIGGLIGGLIGTARALVDTAGDIIDGGY